jgi:hypothetical protein
MEAAGKLMEGLAAASRVVAEELEPRAPAAGNGERQPAVPQQAQGTASPEANEGATAEPKAPPEGHSPA